MPDDQAQNSEPTPQTAPVESEPAEPVSEPVPTPTEPTPQPETPTAQIPASEPIDIPSFDNSPTPLPPTSAPTPQPPAPSRAPQARSVRDLLVKARIAIQDRKRKKREKIMQALHTKNKITNDEVEKLLHVSDATATRYLSQLEREGKIKQTGTTGHAVFYTRI